MISNHPINGHPNETAGRCIMDTFWAGLLCGGLIGNVCGMLVMALAAMARLDPDEEKEEYERRQ